MKTEYALSKRSQIVTDIKGVYHMAIICKWTSAQLTQAVIDKSNPVKDLPTWVTAYVKGAESILRDNLYANHLIFGVYIDGAFYTSHSKHDRYYEKHGLSATVFNLESRGNDGKLLCGHYWNAPDRNGVYKPFFAGN